MILLRDGFDWRGVTDGGTFWFRPALSSERQVILNRLRAAGNHDEAQAVIRERIAMAPPSFEGTNDVLRAVLGLPATCSVDYTPHWETTSLRMLYRAAYLWHFDSRMLTTPCSTCKKYWFDPATGQFAMRFGKRLLRPPDALVACEVPEVGCVKGHHSDPVHATPAIRDTLNRYAEWSATNTFPSDPIVQRNAAAIHRAREVANGRRSQRNRTSPSA